MRVKCHTALEDFSALSREWDALLEHSVTDAIFLRWFWQRAWWEAYGGGKALRLLTVRNEAGRLLGIAPLFHHEVLVADKGEPFPGLSIERPQTVPAGIPWRMLHLIGGSEVSDYLDFLVERDSAPVVCEAMFRYLSEEMRDWDMLDLHCLPASSPLLAHLPPLAEARGYKAASTREDVCPIITLPSTWEEYVSSLGRKERHELRRKVTKAEREASPSWRKTENPATLAEDLALFFRLHEQSDPEKAAFWDERTRLFFRAIAEGAQRNGWLELSFIYFGSRPVGSLFCFDYKGDILVYNSGYDPSVYLAFSPGLVLFSYIIHDAIARGRKRFDFLRGDERYKYDLGGKETAVYRLTIAPG